MRHRLLLLSALAALALPACQQSSRGTRITDMADLPLKSTEIPGMDWQSSPLRANAQYILFDANTRKQRENKVGDYYYFWWYDAEPQKPVKLVMRYTQALTASKELSRTIEYKEPRAKAKEHKATFFFAGPDRRREGDVLTWRVELYVDGKLVDSRQSYLWK